MKKRKVLLGLVALGLGGVATTASADIGGTVFRDLAVNGVALNTYGVKDTNELGVAGITVTAFDSSGSVVGTPATTIADGSWSIAGTTGDVRVEFSGIPSYLESSPANTGSNTTVQFVVDGATTVDLGLHEPADYSDTAVPEVILASWGNNSLYSFPFDRNGQNNADVFYNDANGTNISVKADPPTVDATTAEIGSIWGLAYQNTQQRYFSSTAVRRHAKLSASTGTIFVVDKSAATGSVNHQFDLNGMATISGGTIDLGSLCRGGTCKDDLGNTGIEADYAIPSNLRSVDLDGMKKVGKVSFGDMDMEPNTNNLWAVNLNQKALVKMDVGDSTATNLPVSVDQYLISGLAGVPSCTNGEIRPWGLNFSQGKGYLGIACDAESGGTASDLKGFVVSFDPNNVAAGFVEEIQFPLGTARPNSYVFAPWTHDWSDFRHMFSARYTLPQAIVSDIEFDKEGNMNIALIDRGGMQLGSSNYKPISGNTELVQNQSRGDVYHVCKTPSGFEMEGSGSCPVHQFTSAVHNGAGTGGTRNNFTEGFNDNGEFFEDRAGDSDQEGALGGLALLKGSEKMILTQLDPHPSGSVGESYWTSQGVNFVNPATGKINQFYTVNYSSGTTEYGKASGIGDVEILTAPAPIEIGNRVWLDANGNGVQDAGEAGIAGVKVQLLDNIGNLVEEVVTDSTGSYIFSSDPAGTDSASHKYNIAGLNANTAYNVRIPNVQGNSKQTLLGSNVLTTANTGAGANTDINDNDGVENGDSADASVLASDIAYAGMNNHTFDFGFVPSLSIGSLIWEDKNLDGIQGTAANEPRIAGAKVNLLVKDGSGNFIQAKDLNGVDVAEFTTLANGQYYFDNLPEGEYRVTVDVPATYSATPTQNASGFADANGVNDSNIDLALTIGTVYTSGAVTLNAGSEPTELGGFDGDDQDSSQDVNGNMTVDFGFVQLGSWSGNVSQDTNNDDVGEVNLVGVEIKLFSDPDGDGLPNGAAIATTTTGNDGNYSFTGLAPGNYVAVETQPAGLQNVVENEGGVDNDKPDNGVINSIAGTVDSGENDANNDFVEEEGGSWSGNVSKDLDNDDVGDENIAGVTITLYQDTNGDGQPDGAPVATTTTGTNGNYFFSNLQPGDYVAVETQPAGLLDVTEDEGGADNDKPNNNTLNSIAGTVSAGETDVNNDFVEEDPKVSIGSIIWNDANNNGIQDVGETGIAGAKVTLLDGSGNPVTGVAVQTTLANGLYYFDELQAGDYKVQVESPANFIPAATQTVADNNDDANDSNIASSNTNIHTSGTFTLDIDGEPDGVDSNIIDSDDADDSDDNNGNMTVDFGFVPTVKIGSLIWFEDDNNGIADGVITYPPAGTVVTATATDGKIYTGTTDDFGNYSIDVPINDEYIVTISPPTGYQPTVNSGDSEVPDDNSEDNKTHNGAGTKVVVGLVDNTTVDFGFTASGAPPPSGEPIPTLSEWALLMLIMMLGLFGYRQGFVRKD